jgi:hypothetical protein
MADFDSHRLGQISGERIESSLTLNSIEDSRVYLLVIEIYDIFEKINSWLMNFRAVSRP